MKRRPRPCPVEHPQAGRGVIPDDAEPSASRGRRCRRRTSMWRGEGSRRLGPRLCAPTVLPWSAVRSQSPKRLILCEVLAYLADQSVAEAPDVHLLHLHPMVAALYASAHSHDRRDSRSISKSSSGSARKSSKEPMNSERFRTLVRGEPPETVRFREGQAIRWACSSVLTAVSPRTFCGAMPNASQKKQQRVKRQRRAELEFGSVVAAAGATYGALTTKRYSGSPGSEGHQLGTGPYADAGA